MGQEGTWATELAPQAEVTCMHGWHLLLWEMKAAATSSSPSADLFKNALTRPQHPQPPSTNPPAPFVHDTPPPALIFWCSLQLGVPHWGPTLHQRLLSQKNRNKPMEEQGRFHQENRDGWPG